jgi:hypothetical protein
MAESERSSAPPEEDLGSGRGFSPENEPVKYLFGLGITPEEEIGDLLLSRYSCRNGD